MASQHGYFPVPALSSGALKAEIIMSQLFRESLFIKMKIPMRALQAGKPIFRRALQNDQETDP
jgi:hypothetical protein